MADLADFLKRADAFAQRRGISTARASTIILNDGKRLGALSAGTVGITVSRLDKAWKRLDELEREEGASQSAAA